MKSTENTAKRPAPGTGFLATLSDLLPAKGTGAPSHRAGGARLVLLVAAALIALLAFAPSAFAAPTRPYTTSYGTGSFAAANPQALTVDQSNGDIYAVSNSGSKIVRFDSSGAAKNFTAGLDSGTNTLTGFAFIGTGSTQVAVDNSGGLADGSLYVTDDGNSVAVQIYATDGSLLGALTGSSNPDVGFSAPCGVAVDQSNGDVYIADRGTNHISRYTPSGATVTDADYSGSIDPGFTPCQLAADSGRVYAVDWGAASGTAGSNLVRFKASSFATGTPPSPSGTTIDPSALGVAVDPSTGDVYADNGNQVSVYHQGGQAAYTFGSSADFGTTSIGVAVKAGGNAYVGDRVSAATGRQIDVYGPPSPPPARPYTTSYGTGSFAAANPQALTVDQSNGDIYAVSNSGSKIVRFDSSGAAKNFTAGPDSGTNTLTGFFFIGTAGAQVAVDNSGGPAAGSLYVPDGGSVSVAIYATDGSSLGALTGSSNPDVGFSAPCGVAVDQSNGDVYVADRGSNRIWRYTPSGATVTDADYSGSIDPGFTPCQLAADSGRVYAVDWGAASGTAGANLVRFKASSFATGTPPSPSGTTIDPSALGVAVDPSTGDVYADNGNQVSVYHQGGQAAYTFGSSADFGTTSIGVAVKAGGNAYVGDRVSAATGRQIDVYGPEVFGHQLTVTKAGPGTGTVTSSPPGIDCGPTCSAPFAPGTITLTAAPNPGTQFKGWSGCDSAAGDQCTIDLQADATLTATFATAPQVSAEVATQVATTGALLTGKVNPSADSTTFHFDYGLDSTYGSSTPESSPIGSDNADHAVSRFLTNLQPNTTYHFRLVATNGVGTTQGADQTFTTYASPPQFGSCPNDQFRTGPSAALPDCRAYEQASPDNKNGIDVQGDQDLLQASDSGDAVTFDSHSAFPGAVGAQDFPTYMARRGATDWSTRGLFPPSASADRVTPEGWTPDLKHSFSSGSSLTANAPGRAFFDQDTETNQFTTIHSYTNDAAGRSRFLGASSDGSKVFFDNAVSQLTPDAIPGHRNIYAWDRATGQTTLVSVLPDSACGTPPCAATDAFAGPYDGTGSDIGFYVQQRHAISSSGDAAFFSTGQPRQVYLRKDPLGASPSTEQISASRRTDCADHDPCNNTPEPDPVGTAAATFQAATPSGSKAFFTSSQELTDDANTGPLATDFPAIARADLPGGDNVNRNFLSTTAHDVAVDGSYIYWTDPKAGTIGRATIDGTTEVNPNFITNAGTPLSVAVDAGHIYWTNDPGDPENHFIAPGGSIGRADLSDGANADPGCITTSGNPTGLAVGAGADANHLYWGNDDPATNVFSSHSIARADISGDCAAATASANQAFVPLFFPERPAGIAADAAHIYVQIDPNSAGSYIARVDLDGTNLTHEFIHTGIDSGDAEKSDLTIDDASIYWSDFPAGKIYRAPIDASGGREEVVANAGAAEGIAVDPAHHLYWVTNQGASNSNPGNDLYSYDAGSGQLSDLTPDSTDVNGADVQGVVGTSDDGSYVYFAANGDLDGPGGPAPGPDPTDPCRLTQPNLGANGISGHCSLYLWHNGAITYIAPQLAVASGPARSDAANWFLSESSSPALPASGRVSADGTAILFRSTLPITGYDSTPSSPVCGLPGSGGNNPSCPQFYRYHVGDPAPTCVTCNPTGAAPGDRPTLESVNSPGLGNPHDGTVLTRNLSADGSRVVFETTDRLTAADTNSATCGDVLLDRRDCLDVYEWEAPDSGSCTAASSAYSSQDGGCLYLLSGGKGPKPSYLVDASSSGDDVFILTRDSLVPRDGDSITDVYDARAGGGLAAQHAVSPPPCGSAEQCHGPTTSPSSSPGAASAAFSGPDTPQPTRPKRCARGKVRRGGRCVSRHPHKKKHKRHRRARRANTSLGGNR